MKNIRFIRHNRLAWKYYDYNHLSFSELRNLGMNLWEYHITSEKPQYSFDREEYDICFTSTQTRTIETAAMLWFSLPFQRRELGEIYFDLNQIMDEKIFQTSWFSSVRTVVWESFFQRRIGIETPESVLMRIKNFVQELQATNHTDIFVVSHGFLLQLIYCLLILDADFTQISYEDFVALNIQPISYLEGFEVKI